MTNATAIKRTGLYTDVATVATECRRRAGQLDALSVIGGIISGVLSLDQALDRVLDVILTVMDMEAGEVCLLDATHKEVFVTRHRGLTKEAFLERDRFTVGQGIPGLVVQAGESIVIPNVACDSRFLRRKVVAAGFKTFAAFPLRARGEVIGSFDLAARLERTFTESDLRLLSTVGAVMGMVVADACQCEELSCAIARLTEKVEQLQRTQDELVARERLRAVGEPPSVVHDVRSVRGVLRLLSSSN